jgi:hypothetical protein
LTYDVLERLTRRWWFYLLLFLIPGLIPPVTSTGFGYLRDMGDFFYTVTEAEYMQRYIFEPFMPAAHLGVILFLGSLFFLGKSFGRYFSFLIGIHYLYISYIQAIAVTDEYGIVVVSELFVWGLVVVIAWFWEAIQDKTVYRLDGIPRDRLWMIPLMIFAFWDPDQPWRFDLQMFFISTSPVAYCMMTPIYQAVLAFSYPKVNLPMFRVASFLGLLIGVITIVGQTIGKPELGFYWSFLHSPLVLISGYCLWLGFRATEGSIMVREPVAG